jgi:hypothetical protein
MTDFGHEARRGKGFFMDAWGTGPFVIEAGGKFFRFEDSAQFGPALVNARGEILNRVPGERSPFWKAHSLWVRQGRRVEEDGITCIVTGPRPTYVRHIRGRQYAVTEFGDEGGETIILKKDEPR